MARQLRFRVLLCAAMAVACAPSRWAAAAQPLRLVTDGYLGPSEDAGDKAPGLGVEILGQVFATLGQKFSVEVFPTMRAWMMVIEGKRDGMLAAFRTSERERFCSFPDEPLIPDRRVFFVRTANVEKLKFSSFDDLIGHDVAALGMIAGMSEPSMMSLELWKFLREHHNLVETNSSIDSLRMLAAGRVDYAVSSLAFGKSEIVKMGLSGEIEPLLSPGGIDDGGYVCFSKARVSPAFVDAFSHALTQFKQTDAFQVMYHKYFN